MGTFVDVSIVDDGAIDARGRERALAAAFDAAFGAIDRVASLMSFHDPSSDLSRLNARAHVEPVPVDPWTSDVLRLARRLFVETDGHFDCTIGASLIDAGLLPTHASDRGREPSYGRACFDDVALLDDDRVAYRTPLAIDLGGIAKGYAVDRAIDALRSHGVRAAVVNAGGDLRVLGDDAIPIFVRVARDASLRWAGTLADGAFATSSCFAVDAGDAALDQSPSALVDPFTRRILSTGKAYSIVAPTCAIADGLTKALASTDGLGDRCLRAFGAAQMIH